jgi:hypothetical protein
VAHPPSGVIVTIVPESRPFGDHFPVLFDSF